MLRFGAQSKISFKPKIRGGHYGQRSVSAHTGRTHERTDQSANVKKVLANSEPSTHGGKADIARTRRHVR